MKLYIGAPTHYGQEPGFVSSLMALVTALPELGVSQVQVNMPSGDSLVHRVRNRTAADFLESDATHMLWLDTDIVFNVEDVALLLKAGHALCGGAYPKKQIDWEQVHEAAERGSPKTELHEHAASFVVVPDGEARVHNCCIPVKYLGTGFLLVAREVYEAIAKQEPQNWYASGMASDLGRRTHCFFDTPIVDNNLLSEDYSFCRKAKQAGYQPMLHLSVSLGHVGSHCFRGRLEHMFTERVA